MQFRSARFLAMAILLKPVKTSHSAWKPRPVTYSPYQCIVPLKLCLAVASYENRWNFLQTREFEGSETNEKK
ncbi:hypothetical protein MPTK1_3g24870 [Marchantia polymorpha subsp. ruderalis]